MAKPGSICPHPARAALHRAVWARVFRRPSVASPSRNKSAHPRPVIFNASVPHRQRFTTDFLRVFNDFPPVPLRIYPGRLRRGCGADAEHSSLSGPATGRTRQIEQQK